MNRRAAENGSNSSLELLRLDDGLDGGGSGSGGRPGRGDSDIVQQLQLLIQEPMENLQLDGGRTDVGSNGSILGDVAENSDGSSFHIASGVVTPTTAVATTATIDTSAGGHTWDFLANAAQMFERVSELREVAAADIRKGYDMQGYQWRGYEIQKRLYMTYRRQVYPQYQCVQHDVQAVRKHANCVDNTASFYSFRSSSLGDGYRGQINHFQLRDLLCATSNYDVYYHHADGVYCWNPWQRSRRSVMSRSQMPKSFRVSSLCVDRGVVFTGDYRGRYCVKSLWSDDDESNGVGTGGLGLVDADNDIVNHATSGVARGGAPQILASHNSGCLRQLDLGRLEVVDTVPFEWAVNCSATMPDGSLDCVVGDCVDGLLLDRRVGPRAAVVSRLSGHQDFSFACAFSPDGRLVATGSQDSSARVYDVRWPQRALATLCGYMGAMRVVEFSGSGRFLMAAEPADYVHIYDVQASFASAQDIEFMGEVSGAAFSPDSNCLFVGISDALHGSGLAEFTEHR
ncbi:hypothetical protein IWW47_002219 [Coemansia sp. RSA 2052]|nr:hypothetical protein IWW47_002219 [Coemansia sp. RSA 2052]